jgi:hypothetical protein
MTLVSVEAEIDLEDIDDVYIKNEFHARNLNDNELIHEALTCLRQGRFLDAQTALERHLWPKRISHLDYNKAMAEKRARANAATAPVAVAA